MTRVRTKTGEFRTRHGGNDFVVTTAGIDLPDDLAESLRSNPNIEIVGQNPGRPSVVAAPAPPAPELDPRTGTPLPKMEEVPERTRPLNPKIESPKFDHETGKVRDPSDAAEAAEAARRAK